MRGRGIALAICVALVPAASAQAADYRISDTSDGAPAPVPGDCQAGTAVADTDCSLRDAVAATAATGADDRIFLDSGTYAMTGAANEDANASGDIDVMTGASGGLEIGTTTFFGGVSSAVVQAAPGDRAFDMRGGNTATFSLSNMVVENGSPSGTGVTGGAVRAVGSGGNLIVAGTVIRNSQAPAGGGAIDFTGLAGAAGARLNVVASAITGNNSPGGSGAAIRSNRETHIRSSAITGNGKSGAQPSQGGGVALNGYGSPAPADRSTIEASSIHDNRAFAGGGLAVSLGHRVTVENSTIGANTSDLGAVSVGDLGSSAFLENVSIAGNLGASATASNPASFYLDSAALASDQTFRNTIVTTGDTVNDNCAGFAGGGALTSGGTNIQFGRAGEPGCAVTAHASDRTVNPLLPATAATSAFGGPFYLPGAGSPAIDAGVACEANTGANIDQRGELRTQGASCDVGSIEQAAPPATSQTDPPSSAQTTPTGLRAAALKKCKKKKKTAKQRRKCRRKARLLPA